MYEFHTHMVSSCAPIGSTTAAELISKPGESRRSLPSEAASVPSTSSLVLPPPPPAEASGSTGSTSGRPSAPCFSDEVAETAVTPAP